MGVPDEPAEAGIFPGLPLSLLCVAVRLQAQPFEHGLLAVLAGDEATHGRPVLGVLDKPKHLHSFRRSCC